MEWWLVRLYLDGLQREFAKQDPDNDDFDDEDFESEATVIDDVEEMGMTINQVQ